MNQVVYQNNLKILFSEPVLQQIEGVALCLTEAIVHISLPLNAPGGPEMTSVCPVPICSQRVALSSATVHLFS